MSNYLLETRDLHYKFSSAETVLNSISLQVEERSIYGFLGPNGAGKTTTLKLILGLLKKQQGSISIFGKSLEQNRTDFLSKIGSLIESPSLYGHLTARENLEVFRKIYRSPHERIDAVLKLVALENTGKKKAGQFSLGMKQRLGIALALLHSPSLLILDEPTNGLDPNSIIEMRELLKKLNQELGITILISSHLLAEIEKLVTHVGVINKGSVAFQGTLEELKSHQQKLSYTVFSTNNNTRAAEIMKTHDLAAMIESDKILMPVSSREKIAIVNQQLVSNGIDVYEISTVKNDLETIFMNLINN
ncbi:ABC transporter ATP-binding protein [Cytophagales bacterium WSM2-2]|nr:ABC transporter ATP-binding protein [Cytophagales bacterium WSM2-2]